MSINVLNHIAQSLDVTVQDVTETNTRLQSHDGSLNTVISDSEEDGSEWLDFISDNRPTQEEVLSRNETMFHRKKLFNKALNILNRREKDILFKRRLTENTFTLDDLSKAYNISKERVRQIEINSIKKISKDVNAMQ